MVWGLGYGFGYRDSSAKWAKAYFKSSSCSSSRCPRVCKTFEKSASLRDFFSWYASPEYIRHHQSTGNGETYLVGILVPKVT